MKKVRIIALALVASFTLVVGVAYAAGITTDYVYLGAGPNMGINDVVDFTGPFGMVHFWGPGVIDSDEDMTVTAVGLTLSSAGAGQDILIGANDDITVDGDVILLDSTSVATTGTVTLGKSIDQQIVALNNALGTITLDASLGNVFTLAMNSNETIGAPSNATSGQRIQVRIKPDAAGRTVTWNLAYRFGTTYPAPTLSGAGKYDYVEFIYNEVDSKWDCINIAKGL